MDTPYNIRKNKALTNLANITSTTQLSSTFVSDFKVNRKIDTSADCASGMIAIEYCVNITLLVPSRMEIDD